MFLALLALAQAAPIPTRHGPPEGDSRALDWIAFAVFLIALFLFARYADSPLPTERRNEADDR